MKNNLFKKEMVTGIIFLFICMSMVSSADRATLDNTTNKYPGYIKGDDYTGWINGTIGENGWYISDVTITFTWNPDVIAAIYYSLDGAIFILYTNPIIIEEDGVHDF